MTEHIDREALKPLWAHIDPKLEGQGASQIRPWQRRAWTWLKENIFAEPFQPIESVSENTPVRKRLRIHRRALRMARRLHWLRPEEAQETLAVTAMLLGFDKVVRTERGRR